MDLKTILRSLPLSIVALFLVVGVLYATTTIGTDIYTDGDLTVVGTADVTGASTFRSDVTLVNADVLVPEGYGIDSSVDDATMNIGTTTAGVINFGNIGSTNNFTGLVHNFSGETVFGNTSNVAYTPQVVDASVGGSTTVTPTGTYILLTCANSPVVTLSEDGVRAGQPLIITRSSSSASNCTFYDVAGVQKTAETVADDGVVLGSLSSLTFIHDGTQWIQIGASSNIN